MILLAMIGIDLHRRDIAAAGGQRARDIVAAARADHQRLRAGPQIVREPGAVVREIAALVWR